MDLREIGINEANWIQLAQDRVQWRACVKVKVKLSLCLNRHHAMMTYWGVEVWLHVFLTSALD
jgi:hypothetical protein